MSQKQTEITICTVPWCEDPLHGNGLCDRHYQINKRNGHPYLRLDRPDIIPIDAVRLKPAEVKVLRAMADGEFRFMPDIERATGYTKRTIQDAMSSLRERFGYNVIIHDRKYKAFCLKERIAKKR